MPSHKTTLSLPKSIYGISGQEKRKTRPDFARGLLDYREALLRCLESVKSPVETCEISLEESLGRVLRKDMECAVYVPPFNRSMMDGYAVRSADIKSASAGKPVKLFLTGEIPAGFSTARSVKPGETMRIMTGAAVPHGADAVVKLEVTSCWDGRTVMFFDSAVKTTTSFPEGRICARCGDRKGRAGCDTFHGRSFRRKWNLSGYGFSECLFGDYLHGKRTGQGRICSV